jgi:ribokinase
MTRARSNTDVVVLGGANSDYLVRGPKLPDPGETVEGDAFQAAPGGKGANQAVAVARLGGRVAFVGCVGQDPRGDDLLSRLQTEGVQTGQVVRTTQAPTGVALIFVGERGQKQIVVAPGANRRMQVHDVEAAVEAITTSRVLLTQLELPLECVTAGLRIAHRAGVRVVLDPAPARRLPRALLSLVDVIRPNAAEAGTLTGITVKTRASARKAARALLDQGVRAVAIQAGDEGNLLLWNGGERWLPKIPVLTVDATGAGDAFVAALSLRLAQGIAFEDAGPFASAAAALTTTVLGAQAGLPRREAVLRLLERLKQPH